MNIIIVDDLSPITLTYKAILLREGYEVEGFTKPLEALSYMQQNPDQFDLVITDLYMDEMNGIDIMLAAKDINPNAKTLCITGGGAYDQDTSLMQTARVVADTLAFKPIHSGQLTGMVSALLKTIRPAAAQTA
jgi:DNA-binding NtrC family response regulator